nr:3'-5' exonuclease [Maribellus sp. YY47]
MEQNYRSTQMIVNAANSVISKNKKQIQKNVFSENAEGRPIKVLSALTDNEEGFLVAQEIAQFQLREHYKFSDFAVLYRTNMQSRIIEEALRKRNIPYKIYGGLSFYQRKEIKDLLSYFRMTINPDDNEALKRVINYPARGIGQTTIGKLEMAAVSNETSMWKVISALPGINYSQVNKGTASKLMDFVALINRFKKLAQENDAFETAKTIAEQTGIQKELYNDKSPEGLSRHENIQELLNGIQEFSITAKEQGDPDKLGNYLEDVALLTDQDNEKDEEKNKVTLMTVHSAKGLEFKNVFIVGMEENLFPSQRQGEKATLESLEEERRLFYVALTRAEENAWLSYANQRYRWGNLDFCTPSRFLEELDERYTDGFTPTGTLASPSAEQSNVSYSSPGQRFARRQPATSFKTRDSQNILNKKSVSLKETGGSDTFQGDDPSKIQPGMTVQHQRFGEGKVLNIEGVAPDLKATVFFRTTGQKQLLLKFAKLRIKT